jgi:predicted phage-related endonuclease
MITEAQREKRKAGIFASDVARILEGDGVRVALEKMGELEPDNLDGITSIELGNILEKPVLDAYERERPALALHRSPDTILHPEFTWMGCHLDGLAIQSDHKRVVEAKAFSAFNRDGWGEPGTDEIPMPRLWQCVAQMACTGAQYADIPITFVNEKVLAQFLTTGTVPIDIYTIKRDEDLIQYAIAESKKVWDCVFEGELPTPVKPGDAELIWRRSVPGKKIEATDDIAAMWIDLKYARQNLKDAETKKDLVEAKIKAFMQDASELTYHGKLLTTWKNNKDGEKFDMDGFELLHPDLKREFMRPKPGARVFLVKE